MNKSDAWKASSKFGLLKRLFWIPRTNLSPSNVKYWNTGRRCCDIQLIIIFCLLALSFERIPNAEFNFWRKEKHFGPFSIKYKQLSGKKSRNPFKSGWRWWNLSRSQQSFKSKFLHSLEKSSLAHGKLLWRHLSETANYPQLFRCFSLANDCNLKSPSGDY